MPFSINYHPKVKSSDIVSLDQKTKKRLKRAIENRLMIEPHRYGRPLRKTLKGYWKLRVGDYRIVFKIVGKEIRVLGICHRKDVYGKMEVSVVEAKKHPSDLLGQVAYGRKRIRILKRGKPMAVMVPPDENREGERLSKTAGWLEPDDPFFEMLEQIVRERRDHVPRISKASKS